MQLTKLIKIQNHKKLNKISTELLDLFSSRIDVLDEIENKGIKTELVSWIDETKLLIENSEAVIGLENFLDNLYEFNFPMHLDEMNLLKEIISNFKLQKWLGEYYQETPKLTSGGFLDRDDYELNEDQEIKIYGEILNFNSIEELKMKFEAIEWNQRMISFNEFSVSSKWCELEFLPEGKVFSGSIERNSLGRLKELFLRFRYKVRIEE